MLHKLQRVLPFAVGLGVFVGIANVVPGASCRDGTRSTAIGRRGACSYHGGVTYGWTFIGLPLGLFAGVFTFGVIERRSQRKRTKEEERVEAAWQEAKARAPASGGADVPTVNAGEDHDTVIRRVIGTGWVVAFEYRDEGAAASQARTVHPRWLQLAEEGGERTLCVIADCPRDG